MSLQCDPWVWLVTAHLNCSSLVPPHAGCVAHAGGGAPHHTHRCKATGETQLNHPLDVYFSEVGQHTHKRTQTHTHAHIYTHVDRQKAHTHTHAHTQTHIHTNTHTHTHTCAHTHTKMHTYINALPTRARAAHHAPPCRAQPARALRECGGLKAALCLLQERRCSTLWLCLPALPGPAGGESFPGAVCVRLLPCLCLCPSSRRAKAVGRH